jgi:regulator of ribonuclease activity A
MAPFKTADFCDLHGDAVQVCHVPLVSFGGRPWLTGRIATVETFEDAALIRSVLGQQGDGGVLVVNGGGSRRVAILGDKMAHLAVQNGWTGIVIHGAVRDVDALGRMDIAVFALNAVPGRGGITGTGTAGREVRFGDGRFLPGHFVYGDSDGLVVSARDLLASG